MIGRWILKILLVLGVIGFLGFELLSPVFIRFQIDGSAHDAADTAAFHMMQTHNSEESRAMADEIVAKETGAHIDVFTIDANGVVTVTVSKEAKSYLLHRVSQTRSWYDVKVTATSKAK